MLGTNKLCSGPNGCALYQFIQKSLSKGPVNISCMEPLKNSILLQELHYADGAPWQILRKFQIARKG